MQLPKKVKVQSPYKCRWKYNNNILLIKRINIMDKIILTNGSKSISMDFCDNNVYHLFNKLVESIGNKKQIDTFTKTKRGLETI